MTGTFPLRLEGKVAGPWAAELRRVAGDLTNGARPLELDLSAVTFADREGLETVRELEAGGCRIRSCSGFLAELLSGGGR